MDEVDDQIEEMTLRVETLFGSDPLIDCISESDDLLSCLSLEDSEEDVEYLYRADSPFMSSGSGYESDHSTMSAMKWQFSSSSSHDISYESSRAEHQAGVRSGISTNYSSHLDIYSREAKMKFEDRSNLSCSSCYEVSRGNTRSTDGYDTPITCTQHGDEGSARLARRGEFRDISSSENHRPGACGSTNILRDIVLRDSDLRDGVLRDYNLRDGGVRDRKVSVHSKTSRQDISSTSGHSLHIQRLRIEEPIRPKAMYGLVRGCSLKDSGAFPELSALTPRPGATAEGSDSEAATNSSSDPNAGTRTKKSHSRKSKGLFRSAAVYPGPSPSLPHSTAHWTDSGSGDSGVQCVWGPATPALERGFVRSPYSDISERPLKGLLGEISMNRRLGTEIRSDADDTPGRTSPVDA